MTYWTYCVGGFGVAIMWVVSTLKGAYYCIIKRNPALKALVMSPNDELEHAPPR